MFRLRLLAAIGGALLAGLGVATIATAHRVSDGIGGPERSYVFGVATHGPGCAEDVPPPRVPFCFDGSRTLRVLAVRHGNGHAWGPFSRFNPTNGFTRKGEVTCMTVAGGRAAIGGIETVPSGVPFLLYVDDRGPIGSGIPDRISPLAIFPEGDPDLPSLPPDFPWTCPSPDSIYGYLPLVSGDLSVADPRSDD